MCRHREAQRRAETAAFIARETKLYRKWSAAARVRDRERAKFIKLCRECGVQVDGPWVVLCSPCRISRHGVIRRSARLDGKARQRTATVEIFDPVEVLERDGWRCHMCGVKTPKKLRGSFEPNAPELDHIIPLAAGGEHSRRNTACACRKCNGAKGAKPLGQLRLAA